MTARKLTALVTGASAGLGAEFCRQLAGPCARIIAIGRREDKLQEVAKSLQGQVEVFPVVADLGTRLGVTRAIEALRQQGPVDYLVNNAGFGSLVNFSALDLDAQQPMVDVHITATLALCRAAIPFMQERGGGTIINVSSLVAFAPTRGAAVYGASKAFLNHFSEALQAELATDNITVQCLCPGFTRTEFHDRDSMRAFATDRVAPEQWMEVTPVVTASLAALGSGQVVVVPGESNHEFAAGGLTAQLKRLGSSC